MSSNPVNINTSAKIIKGNGRSIVILGAGVIGLTIAYSLSEEQSNKVTVIARDSPERLDSQGWASPWAGANFSPMGTFEERRYKWEKRTFDKLWSMIPTGVVMKLPSRNYDENVGAFKDPWWKSIVRDFRILDEGDLPLSHMKSGVAYTTVSLRPSIYLTWLRDESLKRGVTFVQKNVGSIEEVAAIGGEDCIIVNASGIGARSLLGVEDLSVYPIRGQTIIMHAPNVQEFVLDISGHRKEKGESTYVIARPDGTVILGGTFQADNWELAVNHKTAQGIYERCTELIPELSVSKGSTILSHNVGLRPARKGGPRVEVETLQLPLSNDLTPHNGGKSRPLRELKVVHAYGFGAAGFQNSWGAAEEVVSLISHI